MLLMKVNMTLGSSDPLCCIAAAVSCFAFGKPHHGSPEDRFSVEWMLAARSMCIGKCNFYQILRYGPISATLLIPMLSARHPCRHGDRYRT